MNCFFQLIPLNFRFRSGYVNGCQLLLSKYQLVVDLAGAFGEQFARVETPLRQFSHEMAKLGKKVQELQRDLTLRRCIIEKDSVGDIINRWIFSEVIFSVRSEVF